MSPMKITVNESDEVIGIEHQKRCNHCKKFLPLAIFSRDRNMADGYKKTCKKCISKQVKEARARRAMAEKGVQSVPESKGAPVPEPISNGSVLYNQNLEQTSIEWIKKVSLENITDAKQRRETLLSMVALMLELSYSDCAAVIAMVNAYRGVQP